MEEFFVYILKCNDDSYYIGHTDNIEKRINEHNIKAFKCFTNNRLPVELIFSQIFGSRDEAFKVERQIKKWSRRKKEALIKEDWKQISNLSKKKFK